MTRRKDAAAPRERRSSGTSRSPDCCRLSATASSISCDQRKLPIPKYPTPKAMKAMQCEPKSRMRRLGVGSWRLGVSLKQFRIGAVGYLNARPLTWALDREPSRWRVRYDVPAVCAALLHDGEVDLGLIPSIEYLHSEEYRFVPGVGIGSRGPVASVALYTRKPIEDVRHVALDTSSRTSVTLIQVLCRHHFHIAPSFVPHGPDLAAMTTACDAGLLIGDPAFDADHEALGLRKIDLGEAWNQMTGLPFIYAAWTGRPAGI